MYVCVRVFVCLSLRRVDCLYDTVDLQLIIVRYIHRPVLYEHLHSILISFLADL